MNSQWQIHRVGLIDFWYYDEEEFYFLDGRMLLRGSNGSGKSVTMQSFIPLLLDGNMRPERLDPFGSRARKMENYLLEEGSEQEERTSYLFMEFKRVENEQFISVGIGLRARKNKKLESWFFCLTDGRRIGRDFFLYKEMGSKIACTKLELRNRIGEGGKVMDTQGEYAQCVNKLLFGFETTDEYKEMLDLLIQLRTPKLSKDFKPSIINDILSNSLQTLTEDDLRPMSEAVENMDSLKTNLDTLQESLQAAKAIRKIYNQYNQIILFDKARAFVKETEACQAGLRRAKELERLLEETKKALYTERECYEQLQREEEVYKEEKKSLDASDAVALKEQEQKLKEQMTVLNNNIALKQKQEQEKKEKEKSIEGKLRKQEEENQLQEEQIHQSLDEMEEVLTDVPFDEFSFMKGDILQNIGASYPFGVHEIEYKKYVQAVEDGIEILEQEKKIRERYEQYLQELDVLQEQEKQHEKELLVLENQLHEIKGELTESIYKWNKENRILKVTQENLQEVSQEIESYRVGADYGIVRDRIRTVYYENENSLQQKKYKVNQEYTQVREEFDKICVELQEWKDKKDPEPPLSQQVISSRNLLEQQGIPYLQFYKTIDFSEKLTTEQASHIEEALFEMGLLDALLVPAEYRSKVMNLEKGACDRYIFSDVQHLSDNLQAVFDVDNGDNDILLYQKISNVLSAVGYAGQKETVQDSSNGQLANTWIDADGHYKIGVLEGSITREYQAKYIGVRARESYRNKQIKELEEQKSLIEQELERLDISLQDLTEAMKYLEQEWSNFPGDQDLKIAASDCGEKEYHLSNLRNGITRQQERVTGERKQLEQVQLDVQTICKKAYLPVRLDLFIEVKESLAQYRELLTQLQIIQEKYRNGLSALEADKMHLEDVQQDLDDIRYDSNRMIGNLREVQLAKESVENQLKLTNYEEIRERLDRVVRKLLELPGEREDSVKKIANYENKKDGLEEQQSKNQIEQVELTSRKYKTEKIFTAEYVLHYVERTFVITEDMEDQARKVYAMLSGSMGNKKAGDLAGSLQETYHLNRSALAEYHMSMQSMFEEMEEEELSYIQIKRINIVSKYRGISLPFTELLEKLTEDAEMQARLLSDKDRELFEDILANNISKKIRGKIHASKRWVEKMNQLMESMQTSSGLSLSLRWRNKRAEKEEQLDTRVLVELLQKDVEIMREEEVEQVAAHFRSKIQEARRTMEDTNTIQSFHAVIRDVLDYRKWFEFQLESQKTGEKKRELTDRVFFTFSGGEKAMAMYVPLFSAVVAKYAGARMDAPRLISLDEAFAGVDETNIKDMFRLMVEFRFNFMINSQILWGDYETVPCLAIYQLIRPENARFVTVIPHVWRGNVMKRVRQISDEIQYEDG